MVFVDSSFWIALTTRRDERHAEADELFSRLRGEQMVVSNHVRGETWGWLQRRRGHHIAVGFLDRLERSPRIRVVFVAEELEHEAWLWLRRHDERPYSFVDATSFALMGSMRIRDALAFDAGFTAAGFVELRA